MKLSYNKGALLAVLAASTVEGFSFSNPFNGVQHRFGLNLNEGSFSWGYDKVVESMSVNTENVFSVFSKQFNEPLETLTSDVKDVWKEMLQKFPDAVASLSYKVPPKPLKSKASAESSEDSSKFDFHVADAKVPDHKLRVKKTPTDLGVDTVKQYSGYLDVAEDDKHFFFWFFESRNDPKNDPVILWLNGGPGCSSLTGLFFELGSSSIGPALKPIYNPYSWNSNASVIFLDQPVNVGFSYSSSSVANTIAAGKDVYAFLELFYKQFPEYLKNDFHIAGESYAGHYIPVFASEILSHEERSFNLTSVMIGNGLTDPYTQYNYYQPMACGEGGYPSVLEPEECESMEDSIPRCISLIKACYDSNSVWSCVPATVYCNNAQIGPYQRTGRNVYDIRTMCEGSNLCYEGLDYIEKYLNLDEVKDTLGAEVESYESCNFDINRNFVFAGDWMKPYYTSVVDLLEKDLPVLIYAGDKDYICNWLGNQAWTEALEWSGKEEFNKESVREFKVGKKAAGEVKNYKHFTFLRVYGGGHMVPYDKPENSLDMVNRWISGDLRL